MRLVDWLKREKDRHGLKRQDFARRIGVSPATITALCSVERPWMTRETAEAIVRETGGEVTPNDFIMIEPPPRKRVREAAQC